MLVGLQRRLIYFPFPAQRPRAEAVVAGAREVTLRTVDGLALGAWLVEAGEPERGVAVLVANGNAATGRCGRRWRAHWRARAWRCCCSTTAATVATRGDRASRGSPAMFARPTGF